MIKVAQLLKKASKTKKHASILQVFCFLRGILFQHKNGDSL
jgi:hypothetical protein